MVRIVLLRLLESYFRHRWLYVLPVVIALVAGSVYVLSLPPEYTASGQLYVSQENLLANLTATSSGGSWWSTAAQSTVSEVNELMSTQSFVRTVIQKTDLEQQMSGGPDVVEEIILYVRENVSVDAVGEKLVAISVTGDDPNIVYQLVIATMDTYVQWKINSSYQESIAALSFFDNLIAPYQNEVDKARSELIAFLTVHPEPVRGDRPPAEQMELDRLQQAVSNAENRLSSAQDNSESARLSQVQTESVTKQTYLVIDQPQVPQFAEVSTNNLIIYLAIFLAVGGVLMAVGIAGGALLDRSLRFPIDVRHGLSLPVLAMVPVGRVLAPTAVPAEQSTAQAAGGMASHEEGTQGDSSRLQPQI